MWFKMLKDYFWIILVLFYLLENSTSQEVLPPPCYSAIYCHGRLLHTVQMAKIYTDSKTFVDMKMKEPANVTLTKFDEFMEKYSDKPSMDDVKTFVLENFDPEGSEFEHWDPRDWIERPKLVDRIELREYSQWALELNAIWKTLGRKIKTTVKENIELYSIIWVPNPVIVPGGRFREFYYWDSYWIVKGLLLSEMTHTTRGMIENFLYIIDQYGHIPNGGRIYYLARSQPPLLVPIVKLYMDVTKDQAFLEKHIETMDREFEYWMVNHTVNINVNSKNYTLLAYGDKSHGPRPESYSEDVELGKEVHENKKEAFYSDLKAAAESGWDFSSRWFINSNGTNKGNLTQIKTRHIIPVDLNAIFHWNAVLLAEFHRSLNNDTKASYYQNIANEFMDAITAVLWHDEVGCWLDYDTLNQIKRDYFYLSNIAPLWTNSYDPTSRSAIVKKVLKYLQTKKFIHLPGGIPVSIEHTGEQWDYPNAWPPMEYMMIAGLDNTGDPYAVKLAKDLAMVWMKSNYIAYKNNHAMLEKYDSTVRGGSGSGGEYQIQEGFGWTNGVILDFLDKYGTAMRTSGAAPGAVRQAATGGLSGVTTTLIGVLVSLSVGFIGMLIYKKRNQNYSTRNGRVTSKVKYQELKSLSRQTR